MALGFATGAAQEPSAPPSAASVAPAGSDGVEPSVARWNAERWREWELERERWEDAWREFAWRHPDRVPDGLERLVSGLPPRPGRGRWGRPFAARIPGEPFDDRARALAERLRSNQRWYRAALEELRRVRADRLRRREGTGSSSRR